MRIPRNTTPWLILPLLVLVLGLGAPVRAEEDFATLDLSGSWYVLLRFKDSKSADKTIEKFKDFAWAVEQTAQTLTWEYYPYVVFDEEAEQFRRHAMMNHKHWEPDAGQWKVIKDALPVSARAMSRKRMKGNLEAGFRSLPPLTSGGFNTMTFSRVWDVQYKPEKVQITIVDSLSGSHGLEGMDEAILYAITERVDDGEFRGTYTESTKSGTFRMVKSKAHQVVK
jgi:hypothetical protein